jgi:hypothetical protein
VQAIGWLDEDRNDGCCRLCCLLVCFCRKSEVVCRCSHSVSRESRHRTHRLSTGSCSICTYSQYLYVLYSVQYHTRRTFTTDSTVSIELQPTVCSRYPTPTVAYRYYSSTGTATQTQLRSILNYSSCVSRLIFNLFGGGRDRSLTIQSFPYPIQFHPHTTPHTPIFNQRGLLGGGHRTTSTYPGTSTNQ